MSKANNLTDFLTDVAGAIRSKKGYPSTQKINPQNFSSEIEGIKTTPTLQQKTVSPATNAVIVTPDTGYDGLSKVTVTGAALQSKTVNPATYPQINTPDEGYIGLSAVTVTAISPTKAAETFTPKTYDQTISSGRWLTGTQTIKGDANLIAANIKKGVKIFNVTGSYEGDSLSIDDFLLTANETYEIYGSDIINSKMWVMTLHAQNVESGTLSIKQNGTNRSTTVEASGLNGALFKRVVTTADIRMECGLASYDSGSPFYFTVSQNSMFELEVALDSSGYIEVFIYSA